MSEKDMLRKILAEVDKDDDNKQWPKMVNNTNFTDDQYNLYLMMELAVSYINMNQRFVTLAISKNIDIDRKENDNIIANILDDIKYQRTKDFLIHLKQLLKNNVSFSYKIYGIRFC